MNEYTNVKLLSSSSDAEGLEIPDTIDGKYVTVLGGQTFQSNKKLKSVTLPKRLEVIEDAAFSGCTSLESVDFPSSLRSIGRNAFSGATALKTAHFSEGLQTIGTYAFNGCTSLESVELPSTLGTLVNPRHAGKRRVQQLHRNEIRRCQRHEPRRRQLCL